MAIYEYEYTHERGHKVRVERFFRIDDAPPLLHIADGDRSYTAHRVMSVTARMKSQWDSYEPSDLPPVDAKIVGPQR